MNWFQSVDWGIFLFFNGIHTPWLDVFFYYVSHRFFWIPLYLVVLFFLLKRYKEKSFIIIFLLILTILFSDQTCNLIKIKAQRLRPSHQIELVSKVHLIDYPGGKVYKGGKYGFPSSHAANSSAFALFVILFLARKKRWIIYPSIAWVILISYSRIYLGVHYPSDILAGYLVGTGWALFFGLGYLNFRKKK